MIRGPAGRLADPRREGVWPRIYRLRRGQRLFLGGLGVLAIGGGLAGAAAMLLSSTDAPPALALIPLAFVALGAYLVAAVRVARVVLYEDAIELVELGKGKRRLRRDEIAGRRIVPMQYGQAQLVLELRGAGRKPVKAHWVHETDVVLETWLAALPDLDAEERARAEAELMRSAALGANEAERAQALTRARRVAKVLSGVAIAASVWGWLYPRPYPAAVATLAVLPLVALVVLLLGRGRYGFDSGRTDPRPSVAAAVFGPGMVLGLRAILDVQVLDWKPLLAGAAVGGVVLVAAIAAAERKARRLWLLALLAPLLSFYPWGGLSLANALLDHGEPEVFRVVVRAKHVSSGKHTSYELTLDPWGPVAEAGSVDVGRAVYDAVPIGGEVCLALRPGALGVRWYFVGRCAGPAR
jgi:hypothetical protein